MRNPAAVGSSCLRSCSHQCLYTSPYLGISPCLPTWPQTQAAAQNLLLLAQDNTSMASVSLANAPSTCPHIPCPYSCNTTLIPYKKCINNKKQTHATKKSLSMHASFVISKTLLAWFSRHFKFVFIRFLFLKRY